MEESDSIDPVVSVIVKVIEVYGRINEVQCVSDEVVSPEGPASVAVGIVRFRVRDSDPIW